MSERAKSAIFFDADGVLWPDNGAGSILAEHDKAVPRLMMFKNALGHFQNLVYVVVTNQTFAARGTVDFNDFRFKVENTFGSLIDLNLIDTFRVCYHHPDSVVEVLKIGDCDCRKPQPGMIQEVLEEYKIDASTSFIIGDRITDIVAGCRAKIRHRILLAGDKAFEINRSSAAKSQLDELIEFRLTSDLNEAANLIKYLIDA